jgi:hypothetical protein
MRIELSDSSRLAELCEFRRGAHALASVEGEAVIVRLPGTPTAADESHLRAYLETSLRLAAARGDPVTAEVRN